MDDLMYPGWNPNVYQFEITPWELTTFSFGGN